MRKTIDAVVAGHICLDMTPIIEVETTPQIKDLFSPGKLINLNGVEISSGGSVANTGFALSKLGLSVMPISSIGDDGFGKLLKKIIDEQIGIDIKSSHMTATSYSIILSIKGIDRIILHDPAGNNNFNTKSIDFDIVKNSKLFHFGYPPLMRKMFENEGYELQKTFRRVKELDVTTSLDMSLPDANSESGKLNWESILSKTLQYVDVFLPSVEEALYTFDKEEFNRVKRAACNDDFTSHIDLEKIIKLGEKILGLGCAIAVIKCGDKGIYIKTNGLERLKKLGKASPAKINKWADQEIFEETYEVKNFKSALAAGDTTIAGFLGAFIGGYDIYESAKISCQVGALCCTTYDAVSAICDIEQIKMQVDQLPRKNTYDDLKTYFEYDNSRSVWFR